MKKTYGENRQAKTSKQQRMKDANDGLFYLGYLSTFRKKVQSSELDGAEQSSTTPCLNSPPTTHTDTYLSLVLSVALPPRQV